jgi:GAF domain-containing protein
MQSAETVANLQKFLSLLDPSLHLEEMLTNVARQLVEMFKVDHSGVLFFGYDDVEGEVVAEYPAHGAVGLRLSLIGYPLVDQLKAEQKPIAVLDAQHDPIMGNVRTVMRDLAIQSILIIPLIVRDRLIGGLGLDAIRSSRSFSPAELELGQVIGRQIAVAVDYARALAAAEASQQQAQTLRRVNRVLSETLNLDDILPLILEQLEKVIPSDGSSIYLLVERGVQVKAWRGGYSPFPAQQIIPVDQLWGISEIVKQRTPVLVPHTVDHPHWVAQPNSPIKSWLGLPLIVQDELVGILNIDGHQPYQFSEEDIPLARAFARQAALAINNARLYGQAERRADLLATVQKLGLSIMASLELEEVLRAVAINVLDLLGADHIRVYLYKPAEGLFSRAVALDKEGGLELSHGEEAPPRREGLTATVARSGQYLAIPDIKDHPLYLNRPRLLDFRAIIGMPMKKQDETLGVFTVFYKQPHLFTEEEVDLLQLLATQSAVAIENARLYSLEQKRLQEEARRAEQWQRMQEITSTLNASLDLDRVLSNACEQLVRLLAVDHCGIVLLHQNNRMGRLVAEYPLTGAVGIVVPLDYPAFEQMLEDHQPFASFNISEDPRFGESRATLEKLQIKSIVIAPLVVQDQVIGSVGLDAMQQPRRFTDAEINMIRIVADQIAIAVSNAHTYQAERVARIQADTLREVAEILNETLDLQEVLERILAQLERVITFDSCSLLLREEDLFRVVAAHGLENPTKMIGMSFAFSHQRHFQEIAMSRRPLVIPDANLYHWPQQGATPIRSWIGAPLLASDRLIGLLMVDHSQPNFYNQADGALIKTFADLAAIALENARLYEFEVKQIERELDIARRIQQGFFPKWTPTLPGWTIAAICLPARETGGDFFDFVVRPDGGLGIAVGDVSGKSIPAAMLMAAAQSFVSAKGSDHRSPAKVLQDTNRLLYEDVPKGSFVAISYALLTPDNNEVRLSNGGQLAPFLAPADHCPIQLLDTPEPRLPLGVIPDVAYNETSFQLAPGDSLIFCTDGLVECQNRLGQLFGFEGVTEVLEGLRGQPPDVVLEALLTASEMFTQGRGAHDDVTLVVIQRTEA